MAQKEFHVDSLSIASCRHGLTGLFVKAYLIIVRVSFRLVTTLSFRDWTRVTIDI